MKTDAQFQAAAHTLSTAVQIQGSPKRHTAAKRAAKVMAAELDKAASGLKALTAKPKPIRRATKPRKPFGV